MWFQSQVVDIIAKHLIERVYLRHVDIITGSGGVNSGIESLIKFIHCSNTVCTVNDHVLNFIDNFKFLSQF